MVTQVRDDSYPVVYHTSTDMHPENGQAVGSVPASKVKSFCASGDGVCETGTFDVTAAHLSYMTNGDLPLGATFAQTATGV